MLLLMLPLVQAEPVQLDLAPSLPPSVLLDHPLPPERTFGLTSLLTGLAAGLGQAAAPHTITGPTQSLYTRSSWQCLGLDNATLDIAHRCPYTGLTRRGAR